MFEECKEVLQYSRDTKMRSQYCFKSSTDALLYYNIPNFSPKDTNQYFSTNCLQISQVSAEHKIASFIKG